MLGRWRLGRTAKTAIRHAPPGRCASAPPPELSQPRQPVQVVRTSPHAPRTVNATRRGPASGPRRRLGAMRRLELMRVDHGPTPRRRHDEARAAVAGTRREAHGGQSTMRSVSPPRPCRWDRQGRGHGQMASTASSTPRNFENRRGGWREVPMATAVQRATTRRAHASPPLGHGTTLL